MPQSSYVALALGVLNLVLVAAGLLLVFFDWSAARRREFLYLTFNEEKPGINYFQAARRRREQYTRLLFAYILLITGELVAAVQWASILRRDDWLPWVAWWLAGGPPLPANSPIFVPAHLNLWVQCLDSLGLPALGFGLLYQSRHENRSSLTLPATIYLGAWTIFAGCLATGAVGYRQTFGMVWTVAMAIGIITVCGVVLLSLRRRTRPSEPGMLRYDPAMVAVAFAFWLLGSLGAHLCGNPSILPLGHAVTFLLLGGVIGRNVLTEYEVVEISRHRLGRERQVVLSFLKRIGAAFTADVEVEQVLRIILESALDSTEAFTGAIYMYHQDSGLLVPPPTGVLHFFPPMYIDTPAADSTHRTEELEEQMKHQSFRLGEGVIGEVAQSGKARLIQDVRAEGIMLGTTTDFMRNRSMLVVPLRIRDEPLGVMAVLNKTRGSFDGDDQSLLQALADQGALFINNAMLTVEVGQQERLRKELQIARDIQQRLLPDKNPEIDGFVIDARATSANEVGGDYYDFFWMDKAHRHLGIVVADVSGKGVHAALVVAMIRSAFRAQAEERGSNDVREVLSSVNDFMSRSLRRDMFITCVFGVLDIVTREFVWARAGHEPVLVAHPSDVVDVLTPQGFALGVIGSPDFGDALDVETIQMQTGDRILIYTDGLTEAMSPRGEEFGMQRILRVMRHMDGATYHNGHDLAPATNGALLARSGTEEATPGVIAAVEEPDDLRSMDEAVRTHVAGAPQSDDLTMVYVEAC